MFDLEKILNMFKPQPWQQGPPPVQNLPWQKDTPIPVENAGWSPGISNAVHRPQNLQMPDWTSMIPQQRSQPIAPPRRKDGQPTQQGNFNSGDFQQALLRLLEKLG